MDTSNIISLFTFLMGSFCVLVILILGRYVLEMVLSASQDHMVKKRIFRSFPLTTTHITKAQYTTLDESVFGTWRHQLRYQPNYMSPSEVDEYSDLITRLDEQRLISEDIPKINSLLLSSRSDWHWRYWSERPHISPQIRTKHLESKHEISEGVKMCMDNLAVVPLFSWSKERISFVNTPNDKYSVAAKLQNDDFTLHVRCKSSGNIVSTISYTRYGEENPHVVNEELLEDSVGYVKLLRNLYRTQ